MLLLLSAYERESGRGEVENINFTREVGEVGGEKRRRARKEGKNRDEGVRRQERREMRSPVAVTGLRAREESRGKDLVR